MVDTSASMNSTSVYNDFSGFASLRAQAREDQQGSAKEVAKQFESLFLQMMLKGMRQAKLAEGVFDSQTMDKYRDMYDQQLSVHLAESGGVGLAQVIERQLMGQAGISSQKNRSFESYINHPVLKQQMFQKNESQSAAMAAESTSSQGIRFDGSAGSFVDQLKPYAQKAAAVLGIQPEALLAQAALETGWGKAQMKMADGKPSFNLFGIKADGRWDGQKADVSTLEFRDGIANKERASFRAYESYQHAFDDYVKFVTENPRYKQAVSQAGSPENYFKGLQQAGYATDPEYAEKIMSIFKRGDIQQAFSSENAVKAEES